jgi:hypothetical protein
VVTYSDDHRPQVAVQAKTESGRGKFRHQRLTEMPADTGENREHLNTRAWA